MSAGGGDRDLVDAYLRTVWSTRPGDDRVEIRIGVRAGPGLALSGIVTAFNPASGLLPEAENRARDRSLREELAAAGARATRTVATGTGPDAARWTEPGWLVRGMSLADLLALGARYGQNAIVWIDGRGMPRLRVTRAGFCDLPFGAGVP